MDEKSIISSSEAQLNLLDDYLNNKQRSVPVIVTPANFFPQTYFFLFLLEEITDSFIQSFQHKSIFTD